MTKEELIARLKDIEWDDFEVKEAADALPKNIWETVSAFSNTSGGWLVLGVKQIGKRFDIQGINNAEKIESDLMNALRGGRKMNFPLFPMAKKYDIDGKTILAFHFDSSPQKPIFFTTINNTFIRSGSGDRRATDSEIAAMYRDQMFGCKSEEKVSGTGFNDLNMMSLETYRNHVRYYNPSFPFKDLSDVRFCEQTGIIKGGELTYAGLLMLGKREAVLQHVSNFWVDYIEVPGPSYSEASTRYSFRMQEQDNIWESYQAIVQRLRLYANNPFTTTSSMAAPEDESELYALREGLINFLAHADYFSAMHPTIRVYSNRIEFQNPGRFMVDMEHLRDRIQSNPRNPGIIKLFRYAKLGENAGYGIDKMLKWESLTGEKVVFSGDIESAVVTYLRPGWKEEVETEAMTTPMTTPKTTLMTTPKTTPKKGVYQRNQILQIIRVTPDISKERISELLDLTVDGVKYHLRKLKSEGRIEWVGPMKSGCWKIVEVIENDRKDDRKIGQENQKTGQVTGQVIFLLRSLKDQVLSIKELMNQMNKKGRDNFMVNYIRPALTEGLIAQTHPENVRHRDQKYYLTEKGEEFLKLRE